MAEAHVAAESLARAIAAALDWNSPPDTRNAAVAYLDSVKNGDIRVLVSASLCLVRKDWSSEIRLHGFKMLQHVVKFRWEELGTAEHQEFANFTINLISEVITPQQEWPLKSQMAALVAEVIRKEGVALLNELIQYLVPLASRGPSEAELVVMILRWLPEDITVHNEDLEGEQRRSLLRGLTESLSQILPLLYTLLEKHFGAAIGEYSKQQLESAKQHASTVTAVLNTINAYSEWAPVPDLARFGIIHGCGVLLPYSEFRLQSCEFFKLVCQRKRQADAAMTEFDSAMKTIANILINRSVDLLRKLKSNSDSIDESDYEFAGCLCESMAAIGSHNIQAILPDEMLTAHFLQQMLEYYQHNRISVHIQALFFWLAMLREPTKAKSSAHSSGDVSTSGNGMPGASTATKKKGLSTFFTDDLCAALLDASFQRVLKKSAKAGSTESPEHLSDDLDGQNDFGQYRSRLLDLIKLVSAQKPAIAATRVLQRVNTVISNANCISVSPQDLAVMESVHLDLEAVVCTIFDSSTDFTDSDQQINLQLHKIFEDLLQQLLLIKWTDPSLIVMLGHYLESFGSYLRRHPESVANVVKKLFELLTSIPITFQDPSSTSRLARLQICSSFIHISKAADKSLLPHMKSIADTMGYLQREGSLLRGEHNLLGEAFIVMASSAGIQQQEEVLAWLLEPLNNMWTQLEWQNLYISNPFGLVQLFAEPETMWSIYHAVTFFEKALKRSGIRKSQVINHGSLERTVPHLAHPIAPHLSWIIPPLLRLLRSIHALWSEPVDQALTADVKSAKCMSSAEQASLLGEWNSKLSKGNMVPTDGSSIDVNKEGMSRENDIRNWLKGVRDSGYNVIGLSATIGDTLFRCVEGSFVAHALLENVQSMEFRHLRLLIHLAVSYLAKHCPPDLWEIWLTNLLQPLFLHCQQALSFSWSCLQKEGRVKVPDKLGNLSGLELKVEVMEEKLLRDLTREVCSLLSVLASPALNSGLPSWEQLGPANLAEVPKDLGLFTSTSLTSLMGFLILHQNVVLPALRIVVEVFGWTSTEAVTRVIPFCSALILLAITTNNVELLQFVVNDMFVAVVRGLALESNAIISSDLVELCRQIYIYLSDREVSPRKVLLSLGSLSQNDLLGFEDALSKTNSSKEQKQHMRNILVLATGSMLKALTASKSSSVITNVTVRNRNPSTHSGRKLEDDGPIGLAAIT